MPEPGLPYTLTNGSAADADQVQANDAALLAGITDGTKDLEIAGLTASSATINGTLLTYGPVAGFVRNLGLTYSAGTLTITGANGSALSSTNPGFVYLQSKANPGRLTKYTITAGQAFIDDAGASEIITNLFGATTGIAWAEDVPFFLYAVTNDAETAIAFMISRDPRATVSPAEAAIGAPDDAVADAETSFFSFDSLDEATYDANPCLCIGSFRMRMSASDDWTVQTLTTKDGIGRFHESTKFTYPLAQNGAATGTFFQANGGTAPLWTTNTYYYWIRRDGKCRVEIFLTGDPGTDGADPGNARLTLPYVERGIAGATTWAGPGFISAAGIVGTSHNWFQHVGAAYVQVVETNSVQTNGAFSNGGREIQTAWEYTAFSD